MTGREMAKRSTYGGEYYYTSTTMKRISTQAYIALARPPDQRRKVALDLLPHAPTETLHLHRLRDGELGEVRNAGLVGDDGTSVVQLGAVDGQNVVLDRLEEVGNHRRPERLLEQPQQSLLVKVLRTIVAEEPLLIGDQRSRERVRQQLLGHQLGRRNRHGRATRKEVHQLLDLEMILLRIRCVSVMPSLPPSLLSQ